MQEYLLRLFAGGYNTLYDSATSWIEPTDQALFDAVDALDENHIKVTEKEFIDVFNAWMLSICDMYTALGHTISDTVRLKVRPNYGGYGLEKNWEFSKVIREIMGWSDGNEAEMAWKRVLTEAFLEKIHADDGILVNLASSEMKRLFDWKRIRREARIITPEFRIREGDRLKTIVVYTKMCRGEMTRHLIRNRITDPERLKEFEWEGFRFDAALSRGDDWTFTV